MIYVDETIIPTKDEESVFPHRKVTLKRQCNVKGEYEMLDEIGRGKFGRVLKCENWDTGDVFAAKFVLCTKREDRRDVEREIEIMNTLKHPKLLRLFEAYDNGMNEMSLIMEYIGGGELFDRVIEDEFVLTEKACIAFMKQILEGVAYMHSEQIIHLDLKPENILCLSKSGNIIKIIDFGLARKFEPMKKLQVLFGTPEFVAPEVVAFEPIGYPTDMWAVGVICYVLLSGLSPFMGDTDLETMANVTIAEYDYEDEAFDKVSDLAKDFIDKLLIKEKEKRMTSVQCLKHEWLCQTEKIEKEEVKNNQEDHSSSGKKDPELNTTKHNLSQNKGQWDPAHNYVMFDCETRTMSRAEPSDDDKDGMSGENNESLCLENDDSNKENKDSTESKRLSQTSASSSATHDNNSTDCRKRMADEKDNDYLEATMGHRKRSKTPLVDADDEEPSNLIKSNQKIQPSTVITYDQVQQKAYEIRENKRMSGISFDSLDESCSIAIKSKESANLNGDDISAHADDEQTATDGPTPTPDISEISIPCFPGESNTENATPLPSNTYVTLNGADVDFQNPKTFSELSEQTLWQAAEGTITPLWEVANVGEVSSLGKSPLPSSPSMPSSNAATSRSPSSQSDWFTHGGNTIGPLPSTLSVGDYNKLLMDTKRLMSTHQLPYVAKLTTDSSGDDSDRTNFTNHTNDSSKDTYKKSVTSQCTTPSDKMSGRDSIATTPQLLQQPTKVQSEYKITSQLPPLSPPSVKKQGIITSKCETPCANETSSTKSLMVNGTKYHPSSTNPSGQQRPGFVTNFPRPSSTCGSSPVPYSRPSSKSSPLSSSPKPFSPSLFRPIANSSPFSSAGTPSRHNFTPSPKILENAESFSVPLNNASVTPEHTSNQFIKLNEPIKNIVSKDMCEIQNVDNKSMKPDRNGISNLLTEVDQRIRFSLDIDSDKNQREKNQPDSSTFNSVKNSSPMKDISSDQATQNMKNDLSQVKKDINDLRNELTVTKKGLENGKQPLLEIFDSLGPTSFPRSSIPSQIKDVSASKILRKSNPSSTVANHMLEAEDALNKLHRTINSFHKNTNTAIHATQTQLKPWEKARSVDRFADGTKYGVSNINTGIHSRGIFSSANTGSVNSVKSKFERKSSTPSTPLLGPRQKSATPFRNARSPSPPLPTSSIRRRSPSPINTGNVNKFKNRFEFGTGSSVSQGTEKYPIASGKDLSFGQQHLSSSHQTLPKAFKSDTNPLTSVNNDRVYPALETKMSGSHASTTGTLNKTSSSFNPSTINTKSSPTPTFRPVRSVGSHVTTSQNNFSLGQRPPLAGIQESIYHGTPYSMHNGNIKSPVFKRQDRTSDPKSKLEIIASPNVSPSLSSDRALQMSSHNKTSEKLCVKRPAMVGSIPSRFMSQEMIHDAASFITHTLSNISPSPPTRNRNLSAGSIPSSTTSSTTSPHLSHTPKYIRGPFGYTDL